MRIDRKQIQDTDRGARPDRPDPSGGLTRLALTDEDKRGRDCWSRWMREAGLRVDRRPDGQHLRRAPGRRRAPPVMMGSHVDSVPTGGKYDGQLGVLCATRSHPDAQRPPKIRTRHPVTLAIFTNEEGARFQPAMIASGVMAGKIALEDAYNASDKDGIRLVDELERIGYLGSEPCVPRPIRALPRAAHRAGAVPRGGGALGRRRRGHRRDRAGRV